MNEPAIDLGILLAIVSSYKDIVIDDKLLVFGEVGLSGEVRAVSMAEQRVLEARKLGFTTIILPAVCMKSMKNITDVALVPVENIRDAVQYLTGQQKLRDRGGAGVRTEELFHQGH